MFLMPGARARLRGMARLMLGVLPVSKGGTGVTTSTGTGSTVLSASPALTGTPTAPTAAAATNTTQLATTAFVTTAVANGSPGYITQHNPSNITTTQDSNVAVKMAGMGGTFSYTPSKSGVCFIIMFGTFNNASGNLGDCRLNFGTGSAPASGAAITGTTLASNPIGGAAADYLPLFLVSISQLSIGTAYWFDLAWGAAGGGTSSLFNPSFIVVELK